MRKLALITGATDGIGKATLWRFAREGWAVVAVGRDVGKLANVARELREQVPGAEVETLQADLGIMEEVVAVCDRFLASHQTLDLLFLNANTITQERTISSEGFEANLAVGHLGRALMAWKLESILAATPGSQILCTVGLNLERLDFEDLTMGKNFRAMVALGRWQWANQVFSRVWNRSSKVPMNIFMPGLVKTKILSTEPGFQRVLILLVMTFVAISTRKAAEQVFSTVSQATEQLSRDHYYATGQDKGTRPLAMEIGDEDRVWSVTKDQLSRFLVSRSGT
ncbi:MAG: SDR family NAD(P)-dependent oxidoreductase [Spirochaetales bacterium]